MQEIQQNELSLTARTVWFMGARMLSVAFNFALPLLLVRRLSQHEFGIYKQVFLLVGTAMMTLPVGFGMSAYYFLPREAESRGKIVFNILLFYIAVGTLLATLLLLYPDLLGSIFPNAEVVSYAPLMALVSFVWIVSAPLDTIAIANSESRLATWFIVSSQLLKALLLLFAALAIGSVRGIIYAASIHGAIQIAVLLWYLTSRFGAFWRVLDWSTMRRQLAYALPLGLAAFLLRAHADLHNYFVAYNFTAAAYAIYAIGCFNIIFTDVVSEAVGVVMIPRIIYLQSVNQRREIIELLARMVRKLAALFFPLYFFLLTTGREFIALLFTDQYLPSWPIFAINLTLIPLALIPSAYDPVVRAYPEYRFFLIKLRAGLLVALFGALTLFTGKFGLVGAISAVVLVSIVESVITAWKSATILGVNASDALLLKDVGKIALAAFAAGVVTWFARGLFLPYGPLITLSMCAIVFALVYVAFILWLGIVTPEEWDALKRQKVRLYFLRGASPVQ